MLLTCKSSQLAREYLLSFRDEGVTEALLCSYLEPTAAQLRLNSIAEIYERMLGSAQSAAMKPGVIGKALLGGLPALGSVLSGFDPHYVRQRFTRGWEEVLDVIERELRPRGVSV